MKTVYKALFNHLSTGLVILDSHMGIQEANSAFTAMRGGGPVQPGEPLGACFSPADAQKLMRSFDEFMQNPGKESILELPYLQKDGTVGWCRLEWILIDDLSGDGTVPLASITEVSSQKMDALRLKEENEEVRKAAQTKSDFLANMSHEIRTPIHTITGMSELLLDTALDAEQIEYAAQIQYSADVLQSLINDILDFSKIEAGHLKLESIDFDLNDLVEDSVKLVSMEAHKKGLEVAVFFKPEVPHLLKGDPVRLRQIVVNLFNNAVKFTHEGEIVVVVSLEREDESAVELKFEVRDTGIGIPEDKRDRLFKVFSQVDSSTTRKYGGTGLGLSISRNLVHMMDGEIGVESEVGKGSIFWFTCRLPKQNEESLYRNLTGGFFEGSRALVCDDNDTSRKILTSYLKGWGCLVDQVPGGAEALELMRQRAEEQRPFNVVLVDQMMPGMDGWQLVSEINADDRIKTVRRLLMSPAGRSGEEAKMKLLKWFDGYLNKPIKKNQLFELLFKLINEEEELESVEDIDFLEEVDSLLTIEKGTILVAEDHQVNQTLFKTILENNGYTVRIANNGREALEAAKKEHFELIFMDVQMPEMNGYEATKAIRKEGIEVPIIAVTASAIKGEQEKCLDVGMDDFLTKPFKKNDLMPMLDKWAMGSMVARRDSESFHQEEAPVEIDPEVFNFDEAVETFMGDTAVVISVIEGFLPKVEKQILQMKEALRKEDFDTVCKDAHSIKGSSWNLMARRLGNRAAELEASARDEKSDACALNLMSLEDAFGVFSKAAEQILLRHSK